MPQCLIKSYSTLNGMPHNRVSDIYTDSKGFVWVCTWHGVSRFDGYNFKTYSTTPGDNSPLTHNRFLSVSEDSQSHLWFKVYNHHIYRFNRLTEQFEDPVALIEGLDSKHYRATHHQHDKRGNTWVAIPGVGVVRFHSPEGSAAVEVTLRLSERELCEGVSGLWLDSGDNCWIAARSGALYRVEQGSEEAVVVAQMEQPVAELCELDGAVWMLSSKGLWCYEQGAVRSVASASGSRFTALEADTLHHCLYVGDSRGGLHTLKASGRLHRLPLTEPLSRIRSLKSDSQGLIWITTPEAGISRYNPESGSLKHFEQEPYTVSYNVDTIPKLVETGGRLWIKMNRYGFGFYDRERDVVEPFYNDPRQPECLMTNAVVRFDVHDDVLWLTTHYERGLHCALLKPQPAQTWPIEIRSNDAMSNEVRALMRDARGSIWVGTKLGELLRYDSLRNLEERLFDRGENPGRIYALKEDSRGAVWVGTRDRGLYRLERVGEHYRTVAHYRHRAEEEYSLSSDHIYSIEEDDLGRVWVATYGGGVNLFDAESERFYHADNQLLQYPLEEADRVRWLLNDGQGRMLAATVDGLLVFNPEPSPRRIAFTLVQKIPGDNSSLGNNDIIHMMRDSRSRIWLATYGGGLNRIEGYQEGRPRFRSFNTEHGLPSNICMSVAEDALGHIWVATQSAVSRLEDQEGYFTSYQLYDKRTSASFSEATALPLEDGTVLFGSGSNLYAFHGDTDPRPVGSYNVCFTELMVGNRPAKIGDQEPLQSSIAEADRIDLKYDYSNFRIDFATLNFGLQEEVGYSYKLEGYDSDWNVAGKLNSASYSNVPVGRYIFRVKAYSGSVASAGGERSIQVVIHPPFWLSWWAKVLYLLLVGGVVVVAWRLFNSMQRMRREARVEQEMTDMKLQFFTNISHELRTPLTLILGGIEDVRKHDQLTERGGISLNLAHKNARRMLSLINQLLDFRKIVKNKMELKISRVNLVQLVEDAVEDFRELAAERHIELLVTVSRRSILVWIDLERIESVVYNLLSNAFKFTRNGGRVEVRLTVSEGDEQAVMVVRDNGIGIAKEQQTSIFERFHQASRSVHGQKGSGIGLSLCRDIINLHQGEIGVESRPGEGSSFIVKLRMGNAHFGMEQINFGESGQEKRPEMMVSDYVAAESQRRSDVKAPDSSPKILLVDDNRELRLFMYNNLVENYRVIEAEDGREALEVIRREVPDVVVTDLMMPYMDGIELIDKVRHDFSISHIPMIMLTAKHSPDERIKAIEYGADAYITKPFSIELLQARIDNLLSRRQTLFEKFSAEAARNRVVSLMPEDPDLVVTDRDEAFLKSVMEWLSKNVENSELTIDQLASYLGLGRTTMYNKLKSLTGKSPVELIKEYRITKAAMLLKTGQFSISEVAYKVGFSDPGYFSRCFREQHKLSPAEYVKSHKMKE